MTAPWTDSDLAAAVAAIRGGMRVPLLAAQHGLTARAVRSRLRRAQISLREEYGQKPRGGACDGLIIRRDAAGMSATHGADALVALGPGLCHWPLGDPAEAGFRFCGCEALPGKSYCDVHQKAAYQK